MTGRRRAGVLLATVLTAVSGTSVVVAEPTGSDQPAEPRLGERHPIARAAARVAAHPADRADAGRTPLSEGVPRAAFPVGGAVGYGEAGARFGADRGGRMHEGQDVFAPAGTPLVAVRDGVVVETGNDGGRGNYVAIFSPSAGETYVYLHMLEPAFLRPGQRVRAGTRVGSVGCTGSCFGDHLHFEVREGRGTQGAPRDPLPLLTRLRSP